MYECDCLMLCGDLAGKALVPLIDFGKGYYKSGYFGREVKLKTEEEIARLGAEARQRRRLLLPHRQEGARGP